MKWSGLLSLSLNLLQMYIVYDPTAILELSIVFLVQKLPNKQRLPLQWGHCGHVQLLNTDQIIETSVRGERWPATFFDLGQM